jgi:hypothetical protein
MFCRTLDARLLSSWPAQLLLLTTVVACDPGPNPDAPAVRVAAVVVSKITEGFGTCQGKPTKPLPSHDYSKVGYKGGSPLPQKAATKTYAAGKFTIKKQIILKDGEVLRGAGRDKTTLYFPDGLKQMGVLCRDGTKDNTDCFDWPASKNIAGLYMGVIGLQGSSIGVEDLTIEFPASHAWKHYANYNNSGYNGFELKECTDCWIRDVTIKNTDNGIMVNGGKNNTLAGLHIYTRPGGGHIHIAYSSGTQDNLAINFKVYGTSSHGLTMNWASVGNVFADGWGESIRVEPDHNCNGVGGAASCCKHMLYSNIAGKISSIQKKDRAGNPIPSTLWNLGSLDRCPLDAYSAQGGVSPPKADAGSPPKADAGSPRPGADAGSPRPGADAGSPPEADAGAPADNGDTDGATSTRDSMDPTADSTSPGGLAGSGRPLSGGCAVASARGSRWTVPGLVPGIVLLLLALLATRRRRLKRS